MTNIQRHILLMSSWFPTRINPHSGNFIQRFGTLLTNEYQVSVIHTMGDKSIKKIDVEIETIDGVRTIIVYHPISSKNKLLHWWYQRKALRVAFELVEDVDLLFANVLLPRGLQFVKAKKYYNCPMLLLEHSPFFRKSSSTKFSSLQKTIIKQTSLHIEQLMAVSEVLRKDMHLIFPTTKIEIIPEFVQLDKFALKLHQEQQKKTFIHISTLDPNTKNPSFLFEGFRTVVNEQLKRNGRSDIHLKVVSDQNTDMWKEWVKRSGLESYISFDGPVIWDEISKFIRQSDALILTSVYETFSIVLVEAWLTGIPVISTSVGVASEMPDFLGEQIAHNDIESFAKAIHVMSNGEKKYDPEQIRTFALQYTDQVVFEKLKAQFERFFYSND